VNHTTIVITAETQRKTMFTAKAQRTQRNTCAKNTGLAADIQFRAAIHE
jgi:hypothetical protein